MQVVGVGEERGRKEGFSRQAVHIPSFTGLSGQSELPPEHSPPNLSLRSAVPGRDIKGTAEVEVTAKASRRVLFVFFLSSLTAEANP